MKSRIILSVFFFLFTGFSLFAQDEKRKNTSEEDQESIWDKIYVGGNLGLQFGTVTYIDISPLVGYRITNRFSAGPGITYRYTKIRGFDASSTYGGRIFARHTIGQQFFAHTEYETLNTEFLDPVGRDQIVRGWVPGFFVGGGIYQPLGRRGAVFIYGLYNLLYNNIKSPYQSPWVFNVGFTI